MFLSFRPIKTQKRSKRVFGAKKIEKLFNLHFFIFQATDLPGRLKWRECYLQIEEMIFLISFLKIK